MQAKKFICKWLWVLSMQTCLYSCTWLKISLHSNMLRLTWILCSYKGSFTSKFITTKLFDINEASHQLNLQVYFVINDYAEQQFDVMNYTILLLMHFTMQLQFSSTWTFPQIIWSISTFHMVPRTRLMMAWPRDRKSHSTSIFSFLSLRTWSLILVFFFYHICLSSCKWS